MFSYFSYSIIHENFLFSLIFQPVQDNSAIRPSIKISYVLASESIFDILRKILIQGVLLWDFFSLIYFYLLLNLG